MRVSLSLVALERNFFFLRLGGETDSKSERGGQSDTLNAEGGKVRQEQVSFLFFFNTWLVFNAAA